MRKPRVWVPLLTCALAAGLVILVVHNMSSPAEGSIDQTPPSQAETAAPYSQPGRYKGKYVSFAYPAHFKISPSKPGAQDLETVFLSSTDVSGRHIAVEVRKGSLADDSDALYRQRSPSLYQQTSSRLGLEFTKKDGTDDTFFIAHGDMVASISASAPSNILNGEAQFVASSLKWL